MTRLYGRAVRGKRVVDYVPDGRWESVTMLSTIRYDGTAMALVYEGGTDAAAMQTFVEEQVVNSLKPTDILVMDNLSSHHDPDVIAAVEATGAQVWFLPRYSPDYNPIEEMWSKVKAYLKKVKARTKATLIRAIGDALNTVTSQDAAGWFGNAGYP